MTDCPGIMTLPWPLPGGVYAFVTNRAGGGSQGSFASFNLALHVDDDPAAVMANRRLLETCLGEVLDRDWVPVQWVRQVHGIEVFETDAVPEEPAPEADAIVCRKAGIAIGVLTADCLPVLFCADDGAEIAVAHAGWRGLLNGVLEATVARLRSPSYAISVWLGPAIGPCHFEVGEEVRAAFLDVATPAEAASTAAAFAAVAGKPGKWLADLYALARLRLGRLGVTQISGEPLCTVCQHDTYYSYRHQPATGRFATLILKSS